MPFLLCRIRGTAFVRQADPAGGDGATSAPAIAAAAAAPDAIPAPTSVKADMVHADLVVFSDQGRSTP